MLGSNPRHFLNLLGFAGALSVVLSAALSATLASSARADRPTISLGSAPPVTTSASGDRLRAHDAHHELVIDADTLRSAAWPAAVHDAVTSWMDLHYDEIPPTESDDPIGDLAFVQRLVGRAMSHGIGFGHELLTDKDRFATYSHYQFLLQLKDFFRRISVVGMAERTRVVGLYRQGRRYDAAIGVQVAAIGSDKLKIVDGESQLLLRFMPFGLDWERAQVGFYRAKRYSDPDVLITGRPTVEAEALTRQGVFEPGVRIVVQPDPSDSDETRVLAEIYVKIEIPKRFDEFKEISIVPRCMWDRSIGSHRASEHPNLSRQFDETYGHLHSMRVCSVNIRFKLNQ